MRALLVLAAAVGSPVVTPAATHPSVRGAATPRDAVGDGGCGDRTPTARRASRVRLREYRVFAGARPHDVAPAPDGTVWFTAQGAGEMGRLDPRTGEARRIRSAPAQRRTA